MAPPEAASSGAAGDYSSLFGIRALCDCALHVHSCFDDSACSEECSVQVIHVSSAILAGNSGFFLTMFTGEFNEETRKATVDIHLPEPDVTHFLTLLKAMYSGRLPEDATRDIPTLVKLLVLADRFDARHYYEECCEALQSEIEGVSREGALQIMQLPQALLQDERLAVTVSRAKRSLVSSHSPAACEDSRTAFLGLPKSAVELVLEDDGLKAKSEDDVLEAALVWLQERHTQTSTTACHPQDSPMSSPWNVRGLGEGTDELWEVIVPRIRMHLLSPKYLLELHILLVRDLRRAWSKADDRTALRVGTLDDPSGLVRARGAQDGAGVQEPSLADERSGYKGLGLSPLARADVGTASEESTDARKPLLTALKCFGDVLAAMADELVVARGFIPKGRSVGHFLAGGPVKGSRVPFRTPHRSVFLEISMAHARTCRESPVLFCPTTVASSAPTLLGKRWWKLCLKVSSKCVVASVVPDLGSEFSEEATDTGSVGIGARVGITTAASFPAFEDTCGCKGAVFPARKMWSLDFDIVSCQSPVVPGRPWGDLLADSERYFPGGSMCLRADLWLLEDEVDVVNRMQ